MTLPPLIEGLRRPDAYPHPVTTPVQVVETHVSWVLLTGPRAYKIKKPLRLPFLDYSTLALRRALCEEELRLNRRYAAGLYEGVVAVEGRPDAPRVVATSPQPLEYAVCMLQFDRALELDALVASGGADPGELAAFGEVLGDFHDSALRADAGSGFGQPAAIQRVTLDNLAELESFRLPEAGGARIDALRRQAVTRYAGSRDHMQRRLVEGWVRECHGDLHCGNVVRWHGALTPFDGIEFDPALRFVDVVNDLAFLTMDLGARGRMDLRHAVLNAWLERLGDHGGLALLPYYEAHRAQVRAKVAGLRARQPEADPAQRAEARRQVERYLGHAERLAARPRPFVLLTCGLSGSGKTWLATRLATSLGALHVRSDVERKRLAGLAPHEHSLSPPDAGIYSREFNTRTYARLYDCASGCVAGGEPVIVDAAFLRRAEREALFALADRLDVPAALLLCEASLEVRRQRVASRQAAGRDASEAGVDLLERQAGYWEPLDPGERARAVVVDTMNVTALSEDVVSRLRALGTG